MSIAPPGYETPKASPPTSPPPAPHGGPLSHDDDKAYAGSRPADQNVPYEFKSVQALRGRESSAKAKWQDHGWEFVSENRGKLRTELSFRRVKPKGFGVHLLSIVATFRRMQPKTLLVLVASCALILVASIIGIVVVTQSGGATPKPSAARTGSGYNKPATEPTPTSAQATPAATEPPANDRKRARDLRGWFKKEKMTPSDLSGLGVDAPESMLRVYLIKNVAVRGSTVVLTTDLYPKQETADEFSGACNQVVQGYAPDWMRAVKVIGQDGAEHGSWSDEDGDGTDDSTGFTGCQSDLD